jgi:hypothetical protein
MKTAGSLLLVLVLSTVAANGAFAAPGAAPAHEELPSASGKARATHGGHAARGQIPTNGRLPGALVKVGGEGPGGGKGSSNINGTGMGARH